MSATATPALEVRALSAGYLRDEPVVRDISLSLAGGSMTALIGPNGAGKSTLIKAMLGLVPFVVAERIAFFGTSLSAARHSAANSTTDSVSARRDPSTLRDLKCSLR